MHFALNCCRDVFPKLWVWLYFSVLSAV